MAGVCIGTDTADASDIAAGEKFNVDDVVYGLTGYNWDPTSVATPPQTDFEPAASAPSVTQTTSTITANAGSSTTLSVKVKQGATAVASAKVRLWAKPYGASGFSPIASATTNASGIASLTVKPTKNTAYRWGYDGVSNLTEASPVTSATRTVNARIVIKAKPVSSSFRSTAKLVVTGTVSPVKSGAKVYLFIKKSTSKLCQARRHGDRVLDRRVRVLEVADPRQATRSGRRSPPRRATSVPRPRRSR